MLSLAPTQALHIVQEPKNSNVLSLTPPPPLPFTPFDKYITHLNNFEYQRCILEIIFQREMNLSDIFARLGVVDVHVNHWHAPILELNQGEKNKCLIKCRIVNRSLTVALSLSLFIVAPRESPSAPELEPAGDLICVLDDLQGGLRWNWNFN